MVPSLFIFQMPIIKLRSNDGTIFEIDEATAKCSITISTMLENCPQDGVIPMPPIDAATLERVVRWAVHYRGDPRPYDDAVNRTTIVPDWDAELLKISQADLFKMIKASNFLDIKGLSHVTTLAVALMLRQRSPEELRAMFNIVNDFEETEQQALRLESEWSD